MGGGGRCWHVLLAFGHGRAAHGAARCEGFTAAPLQLRQLPQRARPEDQRARARWSMARATARACLPTFERHAQHLHDAVQQAVNDL